MDGCDQRIIPFRKFSVGASAAALAPPLHASPPPYPGQRNRLLSALELIELR